MVFLVSLQEKSKWFMDKHMKRLKRDIDELEEQHKSTTNELIQSRSQCSYLLRDNSHMKVAVNEATKSIATCNAFFYQINDKVAVCENTLDESSNTMSVMDHTLENDQIRLGREYKVHCEALGKELEETKAALKGANSTRKSVNEMIKKASLDHT